MIEINLLRGPIHVSISHGVAICPYCGFKCEFRIATYIGNKPYYVRHNIPCRHFKYIDADDYVWFGQDFGRS
jgi:hypothetical protein